MYRLLIPFILTSLAMQILYNILPMNVELTNVDITVSSALVVLMMHVGKIHEKVDKI